MENYNNNINPSPSNKNLAKTVTLVCLMVIAVFSLLTFFKINRVTSTISVTGQSEISAKPDYVKFVVTRINLGNDISLAIDDGINGINKLITISKELGGSDIEIKKTFYQITASGTSYSVANAFSVKTSQTEVINSLIKKLYSNGATTVSNITFESNDVKNIEEKLRSDVYSNAKEKAKRIAKSAGKHLGKVISITDDDTNITSTIEDLKTNDGSINISKSASVIYQIW